MNQLLEFSLRHPWLVGSTVAAVLAALAYEIRLRAQAGFALPAQAAVRLINQGATVVDVREPQSFAGAHIVDALNIDPEELASRAETRLKKKRPILLVCENGARSARLVGTLRQAGYDDAWSLDGGVAAWQRDNLPLVATRNKA